MLFSLLGYIDTTMTVVITIAKNSHLTLLMPPVIIIKLYELVKLIFLIEMLCTIMSTFNNSSYSVYLII